MRRVAILFTLSLRNVFRNRRRSLFALATIAMGAMGLFVFMGFNRGLMNQYRDNTIRARWGYGQVYVRDYRSRAHARPWDHWIDDPAAVMATLRKLPGVLDLFPRLTVSAILVAGDQTVAGQGEGIDELLALKGQYAVVCERNRMVARQDGAENGASLQNPKAQWGGTLGWYTQCIQRQGAIVAGQAESRAA